MTDRLTEALLQDTVEATEQANKAYNKVSALRHKLLAKMLLNAENGQGDSLAITTALGNSTVKIQKRLKASKQLLDRISTEKTRIAYANAEATYQAQMLLQVAQENYDATLTSPLLEQLENEAKTEVAYSIILRTSQADQ
jgi:hypothetical protein